jgi:hypothetical protein
LAAPTPAIEIIFHNKDANETISLHRQLPRDVYTLV